MTLDQLETLRADAERFGVFVDFDGTLSDIALTPEAAAPIPGAVETLSRLAQRFRIVAIVSGRRVAELEQLLGHPTGVHLFGLYGQEDQASAPAVDGSGPRVVPGVVEVAARVPGARVEEKGSNVAVHYRLADDPDSARAVLLSGLEPLALQANLRVIEGKRVVELVPASAPTKGDLILREGRGVDGLLYAGDDLADLEAFSAADALAEDGVLIVKVAVRSAETPPALLTASTLVVEGPAGLLELLDSLAR